MGILEECFPSASSWVLSLPLLPRSALEESVGPQLMEWPQEDAPQGPSVGPGYLMEEAGMAHQPGTAWPALEKPPEPPVTTPPRMVSVTLV